MLRKRLIDRARPTLLRTQTRSLSHHVKTFSDFDKPTVQRIVSKAIEMKQNRAQGRPDGHEETLKGQTLLMFFNKPSLRTRISFETGMTQMGGHAIYYDLQGQNLGVKESFYDTAKVVSRMVNCLIARVKSRDEINQLAEHASIPVINALDDWGHPCQIMADIQTVEEHRPGSIDSKIRLSFVGDTNNNVTYDLMRACAIMGWDVSVAGPKHSDYAVDSTVVDECKTLSQGKSDILITHDPQEAVKGADVVYADSFMSYGIPSAELQARLEHLKPYQIDDQLMKCDALFLHCLPAMRGMEVTDTVIDGPQSVVFDEAENRLHAQKAILLWALGHLS